MRPNCYIIQMWSKSLVYSLTSATILMLDGKYWSIFLTMNLKSVSNVIIHLRSCTYIFCSFTKWYCWQYKIDIKLIYKTYMPDKKMRILFWIVPYIDHQQPMLLWIASLGMEFGSLWGCNFWIWDKKDMVLFVPLVICDESSSLFTVISS